VLDHNVENEIISGLRCLHSSSSKDCPSFKFAYTIEETKE